MKSARFLFARFSAVFAGILLPVSACSGQVSENIRKLTQDHDLEATSDLVVALESSATDRSQPEIVFREVGREGIFFAITEVTRGQWRAFVEAGGGDVMKPPFPQGEDHPVVGITLGAAKAFCSWLTEEGRASGALTAEQICRLPTSLEWGAAAGLLYAFEGAPPLERQLESGKRFGWGTHWPPAGGKANLAEILVEGDGWRHTSPVGSFACDAREIVDFVGNAWEWTEDSSANDDNSLRGGSFTSFRESELLLAYEYRVPLGFTATSFGFRPVLEDLSLARSNAQSVAASVLREGQNVRDQLLPPEVVRERALNRVENSEATRLKPPEMVVMAGHDFLVGKMEVSVSEFLKFTTSEKIEWEGRPRFRQSGDEAVVGVSKGEAEWYCRWITSRFAEPGWEYRLPTGDEWSLAAKGSGEQKFVWGDSWPPPPNAGNFESSKISGYYDGAAYTAPVGEFEAATSGCHDLAGNAAEWVCGSEAIIRGGSWADWEPEKLASDYRRRIPGGEASGITGFRPVLAPIVEKEAVQ